VKATHAYRRGRFTDVRLIAETNKERRTLADGYSLDERVTLEFTGVVAGTHSGVLIEHRGIGYLFRIEGRLI
jgi:hypothetical protein